MAYQFVHIEACARRASKKAKQARPTVDGVIGEAKRESGYVPHIEHPQAPVMLLGSFDSVEAAIRDYTRGTKDAMGRSLRADANVLLAGVVSLPREWEKDWPAYKKRTIDWLKKRYGSSLRCVVEHIDEEHPHLHFYCVPQPGQPFELHPGIVAQKSVEKTEKGRVKKAAYNEAMRQFQDDFWKGVSFSFGLPKLGPSRQRLTRAQWKAQQEEMKKIRRINEIVEKEVEKRVKQKMEEMENSAIGKIKLAFGALHSPTKRAVEEIREHYEKVVANLKKMIERKDKEIESLSAEVKRLSRDLSVALSRATKAEKQVDLLENRLDVALERAVQAERDLARLIAPVAADERRQQAYQGPTL